MEPLIGSKVLIVKESRPDSGLWNWDGRMEETIGHVGIVTHKSDSVRSGTHMHTYKVKFDSTDLIKQTWWYFPTDLEVIVTETLITF